MGLQRVRHDWATKYRIMQCPPKHTCGSAESFNCMIQRVDISYYLWSSLLISEFIFGKRKIIWFCGFFFFKCQRMQCLQLEWKMQKPNVTVLNSGCPVKSPEELWKNTDAWASPDFLKRISGLSSSNGMFLLCPSCLSGAAKVDSLWPKEHPSTSKELKKPTWQSLTSLFKHLVQEPWG